MCHVTFLRSNQMRVVVSLLLIHGCAAIVYMQSRCGDIVQSDGDIIISQTSLYYQRRPNCSLTLIPPSSYHRIKIKFLDFDIKSNTSCDSSYLEIRGSRATTGPHQVLAFCGRQLPYDLVSSGAWLQLNFHSDSAQSGRGFRLVYTAIHQGSACRGRELFRCSNGDCISAKLRCDSVDHCGDGSDEEGTEDGTCIDLAEKPTTSSFDPNLAKTIFTILGLLMAALIMGVILWQSGVHVWQTFHPPKQFKRASSKMIENIHGLKVKQTSRDSKDTSVNERICNGEGSNREGSNREEVRKTEESFEIKANRGFTLGEDQTVSETSETQLLKNGVKDDSGRNLTDEDAQGTGQDSKEGGASGSCTGRVTTTIGRFSVQRIEMQDSEETHHVTVPMSKLAPTDPTRKIGRPAIGFVLNPRGELGRSGRRTSKVSFVLQSDAECGSPPPTPTKQQQSDSILKKNPKYPDLQSFESKLLSLNSYNSEDDLLPEDDLSDDVFCDFDARNDDVLTPEGVQNLYCSSNKITQC